MGDDDSEEAGAVASLLASLGAGTVSEARGIVVALKAASERVGELAAKLAGFEAARTKSEFDAIIEGARKAGKFVPANEAGLVAAAGGNVETLKAIVAHLIPVANVARASTPASASSLTPAEEAKCKANGWDPLKYAETKQKISSGFAREGNDEE
jgi:phage I-like protein